MPQERRKSGRRKTDRRAERENQVTLTNHKSVGGVQHDDRGQARWTWASEQFAQTAGDDTFNELKALDNESLSLLESSSPVPGKPPPGSGYNPYETTTQPAHKPPKKLRR